MNRKYKILIADDDVNLIEILNARLESEGFETITAGEGVRAVQMARKEKPDLIILDLMMPVGGGHAVLNNLRFQDDTRDIPVIILTGVDKPNLEKEKRATGAADFMKKPFEGAVLIQKIRALLRKKEGDKEERP